MMHFQNFLALLSVLPLLSNASPIENSAAPPSNELTDPSSGEIYSCPDDRISVFEAPVDGPSALALEQYDIVRRLQSRFDSAAKAVGDAPFNVEIVVDDSKRGKANMVPAQGEPEFPAPPVIKVSQAAGCMKAIADSVKDKAMRNVRLPNREWAIIPTTGARIYIARGGYTAVQAPQAEGVAVA